MPRTFPGPLGLSAARQDQARLDQQSSQESLQPDDQVASGLVRWQDAFDSLQEQEDNVTPVADIKQRHSLRQMLLLYILISLLTYFHAALFHDPYPSPPWSHSVP